MHAISPENERFHLWPTSRKDFTSRVYLLLMVGGTLVMLLALLSDMQPRLTCVAALWSVSGLYGLSELLRRERERSASHSDSPSSAAAGEFS